MTDPTQKVIRFPGAETHPLYECAPPEFDHPLPILLPLTFLELGYVTCTPGALALCHKHNKRPTDFLENFRHGLWGTADPADHIRNSTALEHGERLMGVYGLGSDKDDLIWVICLPYDHTTILVPEEA